MNDRRNWRRTAPPTTTPPTSAAGASQRAGMSTSDGPSALDRADARGEPTAWYDGYHDHANGRRPKWHSRDCHVPDQEMDQNCTLNGGDGLTPAERLARRPRQPMPPGQAQKLRLPRQAPGYRTPMRPAGEPGRTNRLLHSPRALPRRPRPRSGAS
jgi:hypothetical protein